jgi:ribosomal protein S18 acetylase RimI-like enzyme
MTEAENRLQWLGVPLATVHSWSESEGANRLYDRLGYERVDRQRNWRPR